MAERVFKDTYYDIHSLISKIQLGEIGLPDIQRPFVWNNAQARDLFDSMYKGFPIGHLLFWQTGTNSKDRQIGSDKKQSSASLLVIDGQQRLTALFAVIQGAKIIKKDYTEGRIKIAFKPSTGRFEVTDAAIKRDPEFVTDISEVFKGGSYSFINNFLEQLAERRGETIEEAEKQTISNNLDSLKELHKFNINVIELDQSVDLEKVAEIFVRINSKGIQLKTSDFILTLMSVFWDEGRKNLEDFCRAAKKPSLNGEPSPYNHFIYPSPEGLLRAGLGLAFKRASMLNIYSLLRGKNIETGSSDQSQQHKQFGILANSQSKLLDLNNWHEFLKCLTVAGFRSQRMISSDNALMFTYMYWMIGKYEFNLDLKTLRDIIAKWWFMVHTTGRYTGSFESTVENNLNKIKQLPPGDGEAFCNLLTDAIGEIFTNDYWDITFPNRIDSSSSKTPRLSAYWAALNILEAEVLFSDMKVNSMLDPAITPIRDMERHHLFPKAYLKDLGEIGIYRINHLANRAFVEWGDNARISKRTPKEYWPEMIKGLSAERLEKQMFWHALPENWEQLEYSDFLEKRRRMIAKVVRAAFDKLSSKGSGSHELSLEARIAGGESEALEFKESARWSFNTEHKSKSEQIIIKTIAGFMNGEGGSLMIGVSDDGSIIGLEGDYQTLSTPDRDRYELFLSQLIQNSITGVPNSLCKILFHCLEGKDICEIKVASANKPVFSTIFGNPRHDVFWCRQGNRTVQCQGIERQDYIDSHWQ